MKIGFIGTGIMGSYMVQNLLKAGYKVDVYNRSSEKAKKLEEFGAKFKDNIKECVKDKDIVISIVGYPKDVEEVYFKDGILDNVSKGAVVIDMTTSSPDLAKKIYSFAKEKGIFSLDAPVTGGDIGAKEGTMTIFVGGDTDIFEKAKPIFEVLGKNIVYQGKAGFGQHAKLANQIIMAGALAGVCEGLYYSKIVGLDEQKVFDAVKIGSASSASLSKNGPAILNNDYSPMFYAKHFLKDLKLAKQFLTEDKFEVLRNVIDIFEELSNKGYGECGTQVYYKHLDDK